LPESRAILRNLPIGVVMFDMSLRIKYANELGLDIMGVSAKETAGKHASDLTWSLLDNQGHPLADEQYPAAVVHRTG
jgi:PAS domain S-box-containing protein